MRRNGENMIYSTKEFYNFSDILNYCADKFGEQDAFLQKRGADTIKISYKDFLGRVKSVGEALRKFGFEDKNVAVCGANCVEWCTGYLAAAIYCKNIVPADKELPAADIMDILHRSHAAAIITDEKVYAKIKDSLEPHIRVIGMNFKADGVVSIADLWADDVAAPLPERDKDEPSVILFTSGTTGRSKAVALTQGNICSDISSVMKTVILPTGGRIFSLLPLHHTYECNMAFLCCFSQGVTICYGEKFTSIYRDIKEFQPQMLIVVPLMLEAFYKKIKPFIETDKEKAMALLGGKLKMIVCGAAMVDGETLAGFGALGLIPIQGYGMTECSPIIICNDDEFPNPASVGKPIPSAEVKIINTDENGIGELCVKGPMVTPGYYDDDDNLIDPRDEDGWFHTGDLGCYDSDGYYYITGRLKNVIVTPNGKNIYPEEIESKLTAYHEIKEALVYEGETELEASAVCAKIATDEDYDTIKAIVNEVNESNAPYKAIKAFTLCEELPKNSSHKIIRNNTNVRN